MEYKPFFQEDDFDVISRALAHYHAALAQGYEFEDVENAVEEMKDVQSISMRIFRQQNPTMFEHSKIEKLTKYYPEWKGPGHDPSGNEYP